MAMERADGFKDILLCVESPALSNLDNQVIDSTVCQVTAFYLHRHINIVGTVNATPGSGSYTR